MSEVGPDFETLDSLLARVWEEEPSDSERHQLNRLLDGNPHAQRRYIEHQLLHVELRDPSGPLQRQTASPTSPYHAGGLEGIDPAVIGKLAQRSIKPQPEEDFASFLAGLLEMEEAADGAMPVKPVTAPRRPAPRDHERDNPTLGEVLSLAKYLAWRGITSKQFVAGAVAAVVLLGVTLFIVLSGSHETPHPEVAGDTPVRPAIQEAKIVATLTDARNAQWQADSETLPPGVGDELRAGQRLHLIEGFAEIELLEGTRAVLEAPVSFELAGANAIELRDGRMVAHVPPSGYGFTVDTPAARIIDYGTEFGVNADGDRGTRVQVYEGEVGVAARGANGFVGQSARLTRHNAVEVSGARIEPVAFNDTAFERQLAWKPVVVNGQVRFETDTPASLRQGAYEHNAAVRLILEKRGVTLRPALPVDYVGPGMRTSKQLSEAQADARPTLPAGSRVTSYLIHGDSVGDATLLAQGSVTFPGRIVGVIAAHDGLVASDGLLGLDGVRYYNADDTYPRGIADPLDDDTIRVSNDRRTLEFEFLFGNAIDQIRVLVAADAGEED